MREIKFRAWDGKKMIHADNEGGMDEHLIDFDGNVHNIDMGCPDGGIGGVDVYLMQFTGLKDKNGVEIYEGDVIAWDEKHGGKRNSIAWDDEEACWHGVCDKRKGWCWLTGCDKVAEVIGNIYENPGLPKEATT